MCNSHTPTTSNAHNHDLHCNKIQRETDFNHKGVLYWSYLLLGFGLITPWSAFISAVDYFDRVYPGRDALRWLSVSFYPPMLIMLLINTLIPTKSQGHNRILAGFFAFAILLSLIPIMDLILLSDGRGTNLTFLLLLLSGSFIGASNGLVEGSVLGLTLHLPDQYYQAYTSGGGAAAVFVILLRIVTKAAFSDSEDGLRISACIFFLTSSSLCFLCFIVQKCVVMRHTFSDEEADSLEVPLLESPREDNIDHTSYSQFLNSGHLEVIKKLKISIAGLVVTYFVTLTIFPGVPCDVEYDALGDWYKVLLVLIYSIGDFISRLMPSGYIWTSSLPIAMAVGIRLLFIPIVYLAVQFFSHPSVISLLMAFLGITNGYLTLCCFALGQKMMSNAEESFIGGNILIISLIAGLNLGSFGSIAWTKIDK